MEGHHGVLHGGWRRPPAPTISRWLRRSLVVALSACGTTDGTDTTDATATTDDSADTDVAVGACSGDLPARDLEIYGQKLTDAACGNAIALPEALIGEDDVELGNTRLADLYDGGGQLIAHARPVFTPIDCVAGVCEAIRFVLLFEPDGTFLDVFHPEGTPNKLKKYWQDDYLDFDETDMALLRAQCASPPSILVQAADNDALVQGTNASAPTLPEYQPYVVRGAAFTVYTIVQYTIDTQEVLTALAEEGA